MDSNKKDQPSDVKLAWHTPEIVNLASDQTEGKANNFAGEINSPTFGISYAPS